MTKIFNIIFIGGGSYAWMPKFMRDIFMTPELKGSRLVLHDIDPVALEAVYRLGQKIITAKKLEFSLVKTLDLNEALQDADFVVLTITTGGFESMRYDLEIPKKFGVYQSVGDTVGPGGLSRALRSIPVVLDIIKRMEAICPNAWLLNYTNPMSTICRAATKTSKIRTLGHCHEYIGVKRALFHVLNVSHEDEFEARVGGINHLAWILDCAVHGENAFPQLHEYGYQVLGNRGKTDWSGTSSFDDHLAVKYQLFEILDALPAAGDRHLAEFFPFFLTKEMRYGLDYDVMLTTIEERELIREYERTTVELLLSGEEPLESFLEETSGEALAPMLGTLAKGATYRGMINLPNTGQIGNLPYGAVVETFANVRCEDVQPIPTGELPVGVQATTMRHVLNQEMIVEAAMNGDRKLALQVLANDPLTYNIQHAELMLDELLIANKQWLPQFFH